MDGKLLKSNKVRKFVLLIVILTVCWYLGRLFKFDIASIQVYLAQYPLTLSGLIFVLLYVGTTTFIWFGPKDVLRIASAILFGAMASTLFVWIGEMINSAIMFHLSKSLGREYIHQKLQVKSKKMNEMNNNISMVGVMAWRVNPLIPFRLMDLGFGLTQIPFRKYFIGILFVSFVRIYWLQYILASIDANIFKDLTATLERLLNNPQNRVNILEELRGMINHIANNTYIIQVSMVYFLLIVMITGIYLYLRSVRNKKRK